MTIPTEQITGLILAGGRGSRMGGVDKGLQGFRGIPLAQHALHRLTPQVARVAINANRHLAEYAAMGSPVWPDTVPDQAGPLAGFLAGLSNCETPYLMTVPCDSPLFPTDLVARLALALCDARADIAMAATLESGTMRVQPVFCLLACHLRDSLRSFIDGGQRKIDRWTAMHRLVEVRFDDAHAFANANTLTELAQLQADD